MGGGNDIRASRVTALRLQRERSSAYQQWTSQFHRALIGEVTPSELQRNTENIIVPAFQRISTALRTLQKSLDEDTHDDATAPQQSVFSHPAADHTHPAQRVSLVRWIDQLQNLEREHYSVTLSLANQLVEHCTPNLLAASSPSAISTAGGTHQPADGRVNAMGEVVPTDIRSLFKPGDSDDDDDNRYNGTVEWREKRSAGPPPAPTTAPTAASAEKEKEEAEATCTLRVHDGGRCALLRLIPPRCDAHLFFVDCKDGIDELGGAADLPAPSSSPTNHYANNNAKSGESEKEELLPVYAKESRDGAADAFQRGPPIGFYDPSVIAQRCMGWSHTVVPIVRRRDALRAAIEELCEEMQSDISDM
ncbi:hypothetical protein N2W54_004890 [Lotmaria passim]